MMVTHVQLSIEKDFGNQMACDDAATAILGRYYFTVLVIVEQSFGPDLAILGISNGAVPFIGLVRLLMRIK